MSKECIFPVAEKYANAAQADHWIQCTPWNEIRSWLGLEFGVSQTEG